MAADGGYEREECRSEPYYPGLPPEDDYDGLDLIDFLRLSDGRCETETPETPGFMLTFDQVLTVLTLALQYLGLNLAPDRVANVARRIASGSG